MDEIKGIVVKPDTGEIIGEVYEGDKIIRKASLDYLEGTQVWKVEHYYKGHIGELTEWIRELNTNEAAFLFKIVPYIGYTDCCLKYSNGVPLGTEELSKVTGIPKATTYRVINSLVKKDIIYRGKNAKERQFFINPWLFAKGNRINKVLKTMFRNYKIRVLGGIAWKNVKTD